MRIVGVLGEYSIFSSLYILTKPEYLKLLIYEINNCLQKFPNIRGGATILPNDCGVIVRLLGKIADNLKSVIYEIIKIVRKLILGATFSGVRKY